MTVGVTFFATTSFQDSKDFSISLSSRQIHAARTNFISSLSHPHSLSLSPVKDTHTPAHAKLQNVFLICLLSVQVGNTMMSFYHEPSCPCLSPSLSL